MESRKVSIIILNWNGLKDTMECLDSVFKSDYKNFDVIVVDNGSTDGSAKVLKDKFPSIAIIENKENLGYAGGNNIGMRYALNGDADYVWLVNNDAILAGDCLRKLIEEGEKSSRIGLLSPLIYYYNSPNEIQQCGSVIDWRLFKIANLTTLDDTRRINNKNICLYGTALLMKREVIKKIGYLNESYFAYAEDIEYSLRSIKGSFENSIVLDAKIYHKEHGVDTHGLKSMPVYFFFYTTRNIFWFWRNNLRGRQKRIYTRKYIARILRNIGECKRIGRIDAVSACLSGVYCAFRGIGGRWNNKTVYPSLLEKIVLWHPYFLANLVDLNFHGISNAILNKIRKNFKYAKS